MNRRYWDEYGHARRPAYLNRRMRQSGLMRPSYWPADRPRFAVLALSAAFNTL